MDKLTIMPVPFKLMLSALLAAIAVGCATTTPNLDESYGKAVNAAKAQQTINPDASQNIDPVAGVDGQAANAAVDLYHKSFVTPPPTTNIFNIGIGGGSGGGSSSGSSR